ncbi:hypothetical protein INT45_001902 [Circinella minor]|uniref:Transposase n=1 Tax=Circinella minor TaxID=1195481 RepID=A0A8H7RS61_9FUNG|nr:hypothetical protein INT45_001902 [Circinella minor]
MAYSNPISNDQLNSVKVLLKGGYSVRYINKKVGVSTGKISKIRNSLGLLPTVAKKGRPAILKSRDINFLTYSVASGVISNAVEATKMLQTDFNINVCAQTTRRVLQKAGFQAKVKPKKPALSNDNIKKRLKWAYKHRHWTVKDWEQVIWSDETRVNRFGSDGNQYTYIKKGARLQKHNINGTRKNCGGRLMVWSCFSAAGVGYLVDVGDKNMCKEDYLSILQDDLMASIEYYNLDPSQVEFMHDNDPKHTAKMVQEWLQKQDFKSPDLNPIENMWALLKRRLYNSYSKPAANLDELFERSSKIWYDITAKECRKYIYTMPRRVEQVIQRKGLWTDY